MVKIYIDPGHGGSDPGATGNGIKEKDITLKIAKKVNAYLKEYGATTKMSRTGDTYPTLTQRTNDANKWGADFFLSIHINAGGGKGFESFRYKTLSASTSTAKMQTLLHNAINEVNGLVNRGIKTADLHVCRESKMPAVLTENGFIDNAAEAKKMKDSKWIDKVAKAHADGLAKAYGLKKTATPSKPSGKLYKVQVGAFSKKANADKLAKELTKKGYKPYVTE